MNFNNIKYRSLLWGLGALAFCTTSCKDFLDVDVYDQYSTESVKSYKDCQSLTKPLYGGRLWTEYEAKFAWCVNEGVSGILFNVFQEEGALFKLSFGEDNSILKEGYTSLYSGVISTTNQIVEKVNSLETNGSLTDAQKNEILAEARLFRGYAHFLATEYFGETPLILNSSSDITNNVAVPCVSRKTLYTAIEKDLLFAVDNLPEVPSDNWRVSKFSAKALLAKLYLTMGSCVADLPGTNFPFKLTSSESADYMQKVVDLTTEIINRSGKSLTSHQVLFSAEGRKTPSSETLFALYWMMGDFGEGSQYESQIACEDIWSPKSGWGSGKGISYTLYNSFDKSDPRLYELCLVSDHEYVTAEGVRVYYGPKTANYDPKKDHIKTGTDFLSGGQCLMNNVKKYIWGVDGSSTQEKGMSIDRRADIIRLSDVYLMRAEALMALEDMNVNAKVSSGLADLNAVLTAHGAPTVDSPIAYFDDLDLPNFKCTRTVPGDNGDVKVEVALDVPLYHNNIRSDFMQQRRKEFAMEGQGWLDLKRFFYRDPENAKKFMVQMDRSAQFDKNPEVTDEAMFELEDGYDRKTIVFNVNTQLGRDPGKDEEEIFNQTFFDKNYWYLPIPTSAKAYLNSSVLDLSSQVLEDSYPY